MRAYLRREVIVEKADEKVIAWAYVYNHSVDTYPIKRDKWGIKDDDYVWYASYGTNVKEDRFRCYIKGGHCDANGKNYRGCNNTDDWVDEKWQVYPGIIIFANNSPSWEGMGVAFYAASSSYKVYMHLYKITWGQLKEVQSQECGSPNWYNKVHCLGVDKDNCPIYTLTSSKEKDHVSPSYNYFKFLVEALSEKLSQDGYDSWDYVKGGGISIYTPKRLPEE